MSKKDEKRLFLCLTIPNSPYLCTQILHLHMRKYHSSFALALALCALLVSCKSQHYVLQSVAPHRIEVTKALDAQPLQAATDFVAPFTEGVDSLRRPYIGRSEQFMTAEHPESLLSNWVADALVATGERMGCQPDLGICNIGGLPQA